MFHENVLNTATVHYVIHLFIFHWLLNL